MRNLIYFLLGIAAMYVILKLVEATPSPPPPQPPSGNEYTVEVLVRGK